MRSVQDESLLFIKAPPCRHLLTIGGYENANGFIFFEIFLKKFYPPFPSFDGCVFIADPYQKYSL